MSKEPERATKVDNGAVMPDKIQEAIALFNGILQSSPDDRTALEALALAYEQAGDIMRYRATIVRLARLMVRLGKREECAALAGRLESFASEDFDALESLRSIETLLRSAPVAKPLEPTEEPESAATVAPAVVPPPPLPSAVELRRRIINREMDLAWKLYDEAQIINQDEYAEIVEELTSSATGAKASVLSLAHIMAKQSAERCEKLLLFLQTQSKCPIVGLSGFEPQRQFFNNESFPPEYAIAVGALPFGTLASEMLLALLNPIDQNLVKELEERFGRKCHLFLVAPKEFDLFAEKLRNQIGAEAV